MKRNKLFIGSRASKLALIYANKVKNEISKHYNKEIIIKEINTTGDNKIDIRLSELGGKGLFSKNIENELLNKNIDLAVHALKDLPSFDTEGLVTNCFLKRNNSNEVMISNSNKKLNDLFPGSIIGTSSFRREFQLKRIRKDLKYRLIRGNVDTRIEKLKKNLFDAIILSYAGIKSLNLEDNITQIFSTSEIIPSAGQGVIALQCRKDDEDIINLLEKINHKETHCCVQAERNVLKVLEGDCETPVGVLAKIESDKATLEAELFSLDGKKRFYVKSSNKLNLSKNLGIEVGKLLKKRSKNSYKR